MKTYTDIKTLKKAWNLLKELGLEKLLSGGKVTVDIVSTVNNLLAEGKLNRFCQIITKQEIDFEELQLEEVTEIVSDFFAGIGTAFHKFQDRVAIAVPEQK